MKNKLSILLLCYFISPNVYAVTPVTSDLVLTLSQYSNLNGFPSGCPFSNLLFDVACNNGASKIWIAPDAGTVTFSVASASFPYLVTVNPNAYYPLCPPDYPDTNNWPLQPPADINHRVGPYSVLKGDKVCLVAYGRPLSPLSSVASYGNIDIRVTFTGNPIDSACGTAAKNYLIGTSAYSGTLCAAGTSSPANPAFPAVGTIVTYSCVGVYGGSNSTCQASLLPTVPSSQVPLPLWSLVLMGIGLAAIGTVAKR